MMPHPERTFLKWQWAYIPEEWKKDLEASPWLRMFQNAREWCGQTEPQKFIPFDTDKKRRCCGVSSCLKIFEFLSRAIAGKADTSLTRTDTRKRQCFSLQRSDGLF
jgi:hypothetical protein